MCGGGRSDEDGGQTVGPLPWRAARRALESDEATEDVAAGERGAELLDDEGWESPVRLGLNPVEELSARGPGGR